MDKVKKAAWTAALRSGKYKQTQGALCETDYDGNRSYCCLGVLSDQAVIDGKGQWLNLDVNYGLYYSDDDSSRGAVVGYYTDGVRAWAGMGHKDEAAGIEVEYTDPQSGVQETLILDLVGLNDSGFTFNQIADVIDYFL